MMCHRIGMPPISTIGFGRTAVSSPSRLPSPPAKITVRIFPPPSVIAGMTESCAVSRNARMSRASAGSERNVEAEPDAARLQRGDLIVIADLERRAARETIPARIEQVGQGQADPAPGRSDPYFEAGVEIVALNLPEHRADSQRRLADITGVTADIEFRAVAERSFIGQSQPAAQIGDVRQTTDIERRSLECEHQRCGSGDPAVVDVQRGFQFAPADRAPFGRPADRENPPVTDIGGGREAEPVDQIGLDGFPSGPGKSDAGIQTLGVPAQAGLERTDAVALELLDELAPDRDAAGAKTLLIAGEQRERRGRAPGDGV